MDTGEEVITLGNGEIVLWIDDDSSLHLKSVTKFGDPVELSLEEVNELCEVLRKIAIRLT